MAKSTETKSRPLLGVYMTMLDLRKTENVGAIALADMFIETYDNKYGPWSKSPSNPPKISREKHVLTVLESNRSHVQDQDLLDIIDQLIKLLKKTVK